jgi:hypothetical protein
MSQVVAHVGVRGLKRKAYPSSADLAAHEYPGCDGFSDEHRFG